MGGQPPNLPSQLPPITPVQTGGATGSAQGPAQPPPPPGGELDLAEEAAATERQLIQDAAFARKLQDALFDEFDKEQAAKQAAQQAAQVPTQPASDEPAGGSSWDDL